MVRLANKVLFGRMNAGVAYENDGSSKHIIPLK